MMADYPSTKFSQRFVLAELRRWHGECLARQQRIEHLLGVIAQKDGYIADLEARLEQETARPGEVGPPQTSPYSGSRTPEEPS
jgi:hypothetical protein